MASTVPRHELYQTIVESAESTSLSMVFYISERIVEAVKITRRNDENSKEAILEKIVGQVAEAL